MQNDPSVYVDLSGQNVSCLPDLPDTVEVLILYKCNALKELPARLPSKLRLLDVRGCENLKRIPEDIPESLTEIRAWGAHKAIAWFPDNEWGFKDLPKACRKRQAEVSRVRQQKRARDLKMEIIAEAYKPARVERWLEQCGWDILDMMF
jgi:hypothetical protein